MREYQTIKQLYYINSQDFRENTLNGALSHKVYGVNLLRKEFNSKVYNLKDDFNKSEHLEGSPIISSSAIINDNGLISNRNFAPNLFNGVDDKSNDIIAKRISLLGQLELFKIDIVVAGRTDIEVGMTIDFQMNQFDETDTTEKSIPKIDPYYSGYYLITAIQHRISQSRHLMTMQIVKESVLMEYFKVNDYE